MALVLNQVLRSSYIPCLDHLKVVRDILVRSDALAEDADAACARRLLDDVDPRAIPEFAITKIKKAIGDIRSACENEDFVVRNLFTSFNRNIANRWSQTVQQLITFFDTMPGTNNEQIVSTTVCLDVIRCL